MSRVPRTLLVPPDAVVHITWQCHNKSWFLDSDEMKQLYYDLLLKYKKQYEIKIFSYSFMSSHPHLTLHCKTPEQLYKFFQIVNNTFARTYNRLNGRTGQVVQERYKSPVIGTKNVGAGAICSYK
jgi:REP element-mobilizing transposase RayT